VAAIVSPAPSSAPSTAGCPDEAAILAACRENLARYKVPARLVTLDAFPTTESPNGIKIQRAKLREMAERILREPAG
jgi:fatty-acyl-CoA synthase